MIIILPEPAVPPSNAFITETLRAGEPSLSQYAVPSESVTISGISSVGALVTPSPAYISTRVTPVVIGWISRFAPS